jgi:hypothetical protein
MANNINPLFDFAKYIADRARDFTSRENVFKAVDNWLAQHDGPRFLLLTGAPGSGKSAIAARLAQFSEGSVPQPDGLASFTKGFLSAVHFSSAHDRRWLHPHVFAESLALQLAARFPPFAQALIETSGNRQIQVHVEQKIQTVINGQVTGIVITKLDVSGIEPEDAFMRVVREPLEALCRAGCADQIILLVDSLDEALLYSGKVSIVSLLTQAKYLPAGVRFLVTSRPESDVLRLLRRSNTEVYSLSTGAGLTYSLADVERHVLHTLATSPQLTRQLGDDLLPAEFAAVVRDNSKGNFLYVRHLLEMVTRQQAKMSSAFLHTLPDGLDGIYTEFLDRIVRGDRKEWAEHYAPVVGMLAVAQEGLTEQQLADFVGIPASQMRQTLHALGQFLEYDQSLPPHQRLYTLYHRSFADFLLSSDHAEAYWCEEDMQHRRIADFYWHRYFNSWKECDQYGLLYLASHLQLAGQHERLFELVRNQSWYKAQVALDPSGATYRDDLSHARMVAEVRSAEDIQHGWSARHVGQEVWFALAMSSLGSRSQGIPPALLKALVTCGEWSWTEALATARQTPEPYRQAQALCALVPLLPPELRRDVIHEGLLVAEKSPYPWLQAEIHLTLASHLPKVERYSIERETLDTILKIGPEGQRTDTLAWVAPLLPQRMLAKALQATRKIEGAYNQEKVLVALAPRLSESLLRQALYIRPPEAMQCRPAIMAAQAAYLPPADRLPLLCQALRDSQAIENLTWKGVAVRALAPHLPESLLREALDIARRLDPFSSHFRDDALEAVATCLANMGDGTGALDAIRTMWIDFYRPRTLATIAPHLSQDQLQQALVIAQDIKDPYWKAEAAGLLVSYAPDHQQASILLQALADQQIDDTDDRAMSLATLAIYLPEVRQREALATLRQIKDHFWRSEALVVLAPHLPDALIEEAYNLAVGLNNDKYEIRAVTALAPRLSPHILEQAFSRNRFFYGQRRRQIMQALTPYLPEPLLHQAFQDAQELTDSDNQMTVLIALVPFLPELLLRQAFNTARKMKENDALKSARLLTAIAVRLSESEQSPVLDEVLQIFRQVPDYLLADPDWAALVTCLVKKARFQEALHWMRRIQDGTWHANTITGILPLLPADWVPRLRPATERIADWPAQVRVLAQLGQHMSENPLYEVVTRIVNFSHANPRPELARDFIPLLPHLPSAMRLQVLNHTVDLIQEIQGLNSHAQVLGALGAYLLTDKAALPLGKLHELWHNLLPKIAQLNRNELLGHLRNLAAIITILGGVEAVQESFRAIQEAGQWWP